LTALLLGAVFIGAVLRVTREDSEKNCKQLFGFSIFYLFFLFFVLIVDRSFGFQTINSWIGF
jgi:protoheme IX farnesyltransferase